MVEKIQLLEEYSQCVTEMLHLGHFSLKLNSEVLQVSHSEKVEDLKGKVNALKIKLDQWRKSIEQARNSHYFLNYFTVKELCYLASRLPEATSSEVAAWKEIWPLFRVVDPEATSS